jgi:predicted ABC-type ATPase
MLEMINYCLRREVSFAVETTLSGRSYAKMIPIWKHSGYLVKIIFLELTSADLAVKRVADRVAQGGHDIPEMVIRRRFMAGRINFNTLYKPLADSWKT